jgi:hypothetical protein
MEEVALRKVARDTGMMSTLVESSVHMVSKEFSIPCLGVGIAERSVYVVIPPGVLLVSRHITSQFVLRTLALKTALSIKIMQVTILLEISIPWY